MNTLLYNKSCYSLLNSTNRIEQLVSFAMENGIANLGLVDDSLFGAMSFYKQCTNAGIRPCIGLEIEVKVGENSFPYILMPYDNEGYQALMRLASLVSDNKRMLEHQQLFSFDEHLAVIAPSWGYALYLYQQQNEEALEEYLNSFRKNFYLALSGNKDAYTRAFNTFMVNKCHQCHIPTLAFDKALYGNREEEEGYRTLLAIQNQTTVTDRRLVFETDAHLKDALEMQQLFNAESLKNTETFAEKIHLKIDAYRTALPHYQKNSEGTSADFLRQLCQKGLSKRLNGKITAEYQARLNKELDVICRMNYEEYFLIIYDFILYARRNGIYVGPGRGSSVGSLVAYCLGITHLDPIHYGLIFERFLNPERISMPDIDVDFPDDRREEVIRYVREKYGDEHIAHIITFGTMAAKQVLRDTGKALNVSTITIDNLLKNVERAKSDKLRDIYEESEMFHRIVNASDETRHLYKVALQLEGLPKHVSTHAAGIVMSLKELNEVVPTIRINDCLSTQYSMEYLEELGLIKMDFLSLRNLSIISEITDSLENVDIMRIPLDDAKTFDLIDSTDVNGIFQIEQQWVREVIRQYQPRRFEDLAAIIALCRPGAMDQIPLYLQNRANPNAISYLHNDLKPILKETYGIIIYQEQIIQIACTMAGFTLGKADSLRKAISKKKSDLMDSMKADFIAGAQKKGYSKADGEAVYGYIEKFANYGFNKSHALAYALVAYQQAYLKANYPFAFYRALLNSCIGSYDKISAYHFECRGRGIQILAPDINRSTSCFEIEPEGLRMPLTCVRNLSLILVNSLIRERDQNGAFVSYFDVIARLAHQGFNSRAFESLIRAGALDEFKLSHATMLKNLEEALRYGKLCQISRDGQTTIDLQLVSEPLLQIYPDSRMERINDQYEMLNLYLYEHPLADLRKQAPQIQSSLDYLKKPGSVIVIGQVQTMREHHTKKGELMCFVSAQDEFGTLELVFMPKAYQQYQQLLKKGAILCASGEVGERQSMLVKKMKIIDGGKYEQTGIDH